MARATGDRIRYDCLETLYRAVAYGQWLVRRQWLLLATLADIEFLQNCIRLAS